MEFRLASRWAFVGHRPARPGQPFAGGGGEKIRPSLKTSCLKPKTYSSVIFSPRTSCLGREVWPGLPSTMRASPARSVSLSDGVVSNFPSPVLLSAMADSIAASPDAAGRAAHLCIL